MQKITIKTRKIMAMMFDNNENHVVVINKFNRIMYAQKSEDRPFPNCCLINPKDFFVAGSLNMKYDITATKQDGVKVEYEVAWL